MPDTTVCSPRFSKYHCRFSALQPSYLYSRLNDRDMDSTNTIIMNLFVPAILFHVLSEQIPDSPEWNSHAEGNGNWPSTRNCFR